MFNLENSMAEWRRQMLAADIKSPEVLDELENHLREDVEQRIHAGATAEQAFQEATKQVGTPDQLRSEFAKVTPPQPRLSRRKLQIGCGGLAVFVLLVQSWTLLTWDASRVEQIAGLAMVALIAAYIGFLPVLNRFPRGVTGWTVRRATGKICNIIIFGWIAALFLSLARSGQFPPGVFLGTVFWAVFAAASATMIAVGFGTEPEVVNIWTADVWQCFEMAGTEAAQFRHDFIGTEHLLLGLLGTEESTVPKVLARMGVRGEAVRQEIEKIVGSGPQGASGRAPVYTPRALRALRLAIAEARKSRSGQAAAEHVFLGLVREGSGVAAKVLSSLGVDADKAREEILKELSNSEDTHA